MLLRVFAWKLDIVKSLVSVSVYGFTATEFIAHNKCIVIYYKLWIPYRQQTWARS